MNLLVTHGLLCLYVIFPAPQQLTVNQVQTWRTYYGTSLDKNVAEMLKAFGDPNIAYGITLQWNPSPRTQMRTVFAETSPGKIVLRITIYPRPDEPMSVTELLHSPQQFLFSSGVKARLGSYFSVDTKDHGMSFLFLCSPDHDPQLGFVTLRSTQSPDADPQ